MASITKSLPRRQFDVVVVGAGGAGMRCSLQLAQAGLSVAVLSKVFPTRSHTVAAQGGVSASLGNMSEDHWYWHMYDTVKGSDWLGDQDAIEFMCREAPHAVYELEHFGMPFDRNQDGTIYQRPFGGHTANFGEKPVQRACAAADRTGHAMLHTLYQRNVAARTQFFVEWMALDLLRNEAGDVLGVTALEMETGEIYVLEGKRVVLATGGAGRIWAASTNAFINTGDGLGMAARAGLPLQDMEFWQFHPTGVAGAGVLITEGVRGEGGILLNKDGERFMERYAPTLKDLAPRDFVSRSMDQEIKEGRGCGDGSYVVLKLDHLGADVIKKRLPSIREIAIKFGNVDPIKDPIPVVPTIHYQMGGIPTNYYGQVVTQTPTGENKIVNGLYAIGECAATSVHGANRLGTNSLLDLIVFGRAAGNHIVDSHPEKTHAHQEINESSIEYSLDRVNRLESRTSGEKAQDVGNKIRVAMQAHCGVFRTLDLLHKGVDQIESLVPEVKDIYFKDKSKVFNTARIEALEVANMIEVARATTKSAANRTESRGAHALNDHPERDDENWLRHTLWFSEGSRLEYKPVQMKPLTAETIPPKARTF
ncbi:succinate dehydrogenase flavoprotein subunit [Alcaligenes nematophilus]|uniref:Succinate dehydrogenase flavoprotein subunit n=1 Tax=Alcaligenes phenolicus TaxID=232846 RepID=A0ABV2BHX6_9BURK|nr:MULTISPECIES: succinate dehydrogenase flavoprotein subunit [Alcaligenes]MBX6965353.1 succinate dehydrogenase flavoprotein subunit [Providencia rettgeri]MCX5473531.1 succinate dehydrogenase flavoprotein subunit [Alcaligenes nematophilus]ALO37750.1 fumarate reductase [Alcaligenes faecalis]ASC89741.1 succinate dehydrogenase flavoprotein subunit [Alcaligenes faecalis]ERT55259.1 succinate dehydrogenase flavoprotein subunit [Alcaligenes sp. EGD-AK7]